MINRGRRNVILTVLVKIKACTSIHSAFTHFIDTGRISFTHCGLVMPYGNIEIWVDTDWLKEWFVVRRHPAITWAFVDLLSVRTKDIHLKAIPQEASQPSIIKINMKITYLKFSSNLARLIGQFQYYLIFTKKIPYWTKNTKSWFQNVEAETKWLPFYRHFQFKSNFTEICSQGCN